MEAIMDSGNKIVIVVEDEALILMGAVDVLTKAGFVVLEARQAQEALTILESKSEAIHLLFTDIHMPGRMNGLHLAHHVRRNWPHIAVLVASGEYKPEPASLPAGCRFLPKPYDPAEVVAHVRELIAA